MYNYIKQMTIGLLVFSAISCDDADELLNQHIKNGPIVYAGKIAELEVKSGYEKVGVRILPVEDVNRAYCVLRWNAASGNPDSVKVNYVPENYDEDLDSYYAELDMSGIEGNVLIEAWNVDAFGNRSLLTDQGGFVYGPNYVGTLLHAMPRFISEGQTIEFDNRVGVVDNLVSYEQSNGQFTEEVRVVERLELRDAKPGGFVRSKTRYLINENDIDTLVTPSYLESVIP